MKCVCVRSREDAGVGKTAGKPPDPPSAGVKAHARPAILVLGTALAALRKCMASCSDLAAQRTDFSATLGSTAVKLSASFYEQSR